jgi:Ca-activated chloride channel family protein
MLLRSPRCFLAVFALVLLIILLPRTAIFSSQAPDGGVPSTGTDLPERFSGQTYRVKVNLVNVICSVLDKNTNSFVTSLTREDFEIYENGQKQEIENFARETDMPLTLAMLIDVSTSVKTKLQFEQEAATSFFQSILRERDRAMLLKFDRGVSLVQDFTNDPNKLAGEINKLTARSDGTKLYDSIYLSCDEKLIRESGRKAIIILSDGDDQSSIFNLDQATEMALRAEAIIFAISVNKGGFSGVEENTKGDDTLTALIEKTGGRIFFPFKIEELNDNFEQINQELRGQYSIGYTSTNPEKDGRYREIKIKVREEGFKLNYRKGYYAP